MYLMHACVHVCIICMYVCMYVCSCVHDARAPEFLTYVGQDVEVRLEERVSFGHTRKHEDNHLPTQHRATYQYDNTTHHAAVRKNEQKLHRRAWGQTCLAVINGGESVSNAFELAAHRRVACHLQTTNTHIYVCNQVYSIVMRVETHVQTDIRVNINTWVCTHTHIFSYTCMQRHKKTH